MEYTLLDDQIKANIADQRKQSLQAEHYNLELRVKELEATNDPNTAQQIESLRQSQAVLEAAYAVHENSSAPAPVAPSAS